MSFPRRSLRLAGLPPNAETPLKVDYPAPARQTNPRSVGPCQKAALFLYAFVSTVVLANSVRAVVANLL